MFDCHWHFVNAWVKHRRMRMIFPIGVSTAAYNGCIIYACAYIYMHHIHVGCGRRVVEQLTICYFSRKKISPQRWWKLWLEDLTSQSWRLCRYICDALCTVSPIVPSAPTSPAISSTPPSTPPFHEQLKMWPATECSVRDDGVFSAMLLQIASQPATRIKYIFMWWIHIKPHV